MLKTVLKTAIIFGVSKFAMQYAFNNFPGKNKVASYGAGVTALAYLIKISAREHAEK